MSVEITVRIKLGEKDFTLTMDEMRKLHDILQYCFNERKAGLYPYVRQYPATAGSFFDDPIMYFASSSDSSALAAGTFAKAIDLGWTEFPKLNRTEMNNADD